MIKNSSKEVDTELAHPILICTSDQGNDLVERCAREL